MDHSTFPLAIEAATAPERTKKSNYPEPFASRVSGRSKRPLGDLFGIRNFGVNLTRLKPGSITALHHRHSKQDEFVFIIEGYPTLYTDRGVLVLRPGMCAGFAASGIAHHLANEGDEDAVILEIGDRTPGDQAEYPNDDIQAISTGPASWRFTRKDGSEF